MGVKGSDSEKMLMLLATAHGKRERRDLYAKGWTSSRAERAMDDARKLVENLHKSLTQELGDMVCEEVLRREWVRHRAWSTWRRAGAGSVAGGVVTAVGGGSSLTRAGIAAAIGASLMPWRTSVSEELLRSLREGGTLGVLLRRGAGGVVRERWRELPAGAARSPLLRYEVIHVFEDLTSHQRDLAEKLGEDFNGTLGELYDAVVALGS